ncbi:uncharacterized protein LOC115631846 [Scaptodrosophila lebanonensis]|uniref:Uncharacterized protein LOC115631846 n=1 Tax=Drosophila lebanonensis TaxID=7225 RepID=A0A6J2U885_DROLE|nr:uncharacterized protein LOC115631846 [Scaptodrosophila lebanonensis]
MRVYYENSFGYRPRHCHRRPGLEIDFVAGYGGAYYQAPAPRTEVVVVNPPNNYAAPVPQVMPQPYGAPPGVVYQQGYQYQQYQQHYNNPPYPRW